MHHVDYKKQLHIYCTVQYCTTVATSSYSNCCRVCYSNSTAAIADSATIHAQVVPALRKPIQPALPAMTETQKKAAQMCMVRHSVDSDCQGLTMHSTQLKANSTTSMH